MAADTKQCGKCREVKPRDNEHFPHNKRNPDGFDKYCKACWKLISAAKRTGTGEGGRQKSVGKAIITGLKNARKMRGWEEASARGHLEVVPEGVEVVSLTNNLSNLPKEQMREMFGSLRESIEAFVDRYGVPPAVVYCPARFFMPVPDDFVVHAGDPPADSKPAKAGRSRGKAPKREEV